MSISYHISDINFVDDKMILSIDERQIIVPIASVSKRLLAASQLERTIYRISPSGYGVHWPLVDEDISINELLKNHVKNWVLNKILPYKFSRG